MAMYAKVNKTTEKTSQQHGSTAASKWLQDSEATLTSEMLKGFCFGRLSAAASLRSSCKFVNLWSMLNQVVTSLSSLIATDSWIGQELSPEPYVICFFCLLFKYVPHTESISPIIRKILYYLGFPQILL